MSIVVVVLAEASFEFYTLLFFMALVALFLGVTLLNSLAYGFRLLFREHESLSLILSA